MRGKAAPVSSPPQDPQGFVPAGTAALAPPVAPPVAAAAPLSNPFGQALKSPFGVQGTPLASPFAQTNHASEMTYGTGVNYAPNLA